eukprot:250323_1
MQETLERLNREQMKRESTKRKWSQTAEQLKHCNQQKKDKLNAYRHQYQSLKATIDINSKQIASVPKQPFVDLTSLNLQRIESTIALIEDVFHRIESRDHDDEDGAQFRKERRFFDSKSKAWMEDNERMKRELIELQSNHQHTVSKVEHSKAYLNAMIDKEKEAIATHINAKMQNDQCIASQSVLFQQERDKKATLVKRDEMHQRMVDHYVKETQDHNRLISEKKQIQSRMDELCNAKGAFLDELKRREGDLAREIARRRLNLSQKTEKMAKTERKFEELSKHKTEIESQIESLNRDLERQNQCIRRLNAMIDDETSRLSQMNREYATASTESQQYVQNLHDLSDSILSTQSMIGKIDNERAKADRLCVEFEEMIEGVNDDYCAMKQESKAGYATIIDKWMRLKSGLNNKLVQIRNNEAEAREENENMMQTIGGLNETICKLRECVEMKKQNALDVAVAMNALGDEYNASVNELKELEEETVALTEQKKAFQEEYEVSKDRDEVRKLRKEDEVRDVVVAHKKEVIGYADDRKECDDKYKEKANQYLADCIRRYEETLDKKRDKFEMERQHLLEAIKEQKDKQITTREQIKKIENERDFEERRKSKTDEDEEYVPPAAEIDDEDEEDEGGSLRERARSRLESMKKKGKKLKKKKRRTYGSVSRKERRGSLQKRMDSENNNNKDEEEKEDGNEKETKKASGKKRSFGTMNKSEDGVQNTTRMTRSKRKKRKRTLGPKKVTYNI